ncbi:MAG: hypothetical protein NVS3B20_11570 [Polyangiales bacterium]
MFLLGWTPLFYGSSAHAGESAGTTATVGSDLVPLTIEVDRDDVVVRVRRRLRFDKAEVGHCQGHCVLNLPRGLYRLEIEETIDTTAGEKKIDLTYPTAVRIESRSQTKRRVGKTLAVTGLVLMGATFSAFYVGFIVYGNTSPAHFTTSEKIFEVALVTTLLGGVSTSAVGWPLWATSRPKVMVNSNEPTERDVSHWHLALVPSVHGAQAIATFSF